MTSGMERGHLTFVTISQLADPSSRLAPAEDSGSPVRTRIHGSALRRHPVRFVP